MAEKQQYGRAWSIVPQQFEDGTRCDEQNREQYGQNGAPQRRQCIRLRVFLYQLRQFQPLPQPLSQEYRDQHRRQGHQQPKQHNRAEIIRSAEVTGGGDWARSRGHQGVGGVEPRREGKRQHAFFNARLPGDRVIQPGQDDEPAVTKYRDAGYRSNS